MAKIDLYRSLGADVDPRETELSSLVVKYWTRGEDAYANAVPEARDQDTYRRYCSLTAERVLYRGKVMSLPVDDGILSNDDILDARPFGERCPTLRELTAPNVTVAMTFVPLTPSDFSRASSAKPVLARLYCVTGLVRECDEIPFVDAPACCAGHSWFLAGCDVKGGEKVVGRSWWLAAHLLVDRSARGNSDYKRNLATKFIITGDVNRDNGIAKVEMGRKLDLATSSGEEFAALTWIVPLENKGDQKMMKIKYPKNLDECKELIKTMQDRSTQILCKVADDGVRSTDVLVDLLKNNADPNENVETWDGDVCDRRNAMQRHDFGMSRAIFSRLREMKDSNPALVSVVDRIWADLNSVIDNKYQFSYFGGIPQALFLMARLGDRDSLQRLTKQVDIDATDDCGHTALDFAHKCRESDVIALLESLGAKRRGEYELASDSMLGAVDNLINGDTASVQHILEALEYGLSPNEMLQAGLIFSCGDHDYIASFSTWERRNEDTDPSPQTSDQNEYYADQASEHDSLLYGTECRRYTTNVFLEALYSGNEELVKACLEHGADVNTKVKRACHTQCVKETYPHTGGKTVTHPFKPDDKDFCVEEHTIREILEKDNSISYKLRDMVFRSMAKRG